MKYIFELLGVIPKGFVLRIGRSANDFSEGSIPTGDFVFTLEYEGYAEWFRIDSMMLDRLNIGDMKSFEAMIKPIVERLKNPIRNNVPFIKHGNCVDL